MNKTSIPSTKSSILASTELRIKDDKLVELPSYSHNSQCTSSEVEIIIFPINGICPKCLTIASDGSSCLCGCSGALFSC